MMSDTSDIDLIPIRGAMAGFEISPRVEPNEEIDLDRVFLPDGHRSVLDVKRQLVVGNRGMGKSFWTHALTNPAVRERLARAYRSEERRVGKESRSWGKAEHLKKNR